MSEKNLNVEIPIVSNNSLNQSTAQQRTTRFVNDYSATLPDVSSMSLAEAYKYYNSFSPIASVYEYLNSAEYNVSSEAKSDLQNVANAHQALIYQRIQQLTNEQNSLQSQVEQQQSAGINPDLNGVSAAAASSAPTLNPSSIAPSENKSPLDLVGFGMQLLTSGLGAASSISGLVGSGVNIASQKLALASQVADISNKMLEFGYDDISGLGLSRQATKRIQKGMNDVSPEQKQLIVARRGANIVEQLLKSASSQNDLDLLPMYNELTRIKLAGEKEYYSNLKQDKKAKAENSSNELLDKSNDYQSKVLDSLDPEHQSRMESIQEDSASLSLEGQKLSNQSKRDASLDRHDFLVARSAYIKSIEKQQDELLRDINQIKQKDKLSESDRRHIGVYKALYNYLEQDKYKAYGVKSSDTNVETDEFDIDRKFRWSTLKDLNPFASFLK